MGKVNEYGFKCDVIPIMLTLEGPGCAKIGYQGGSAKNNLCGPGAFALGNFGAGIIEIVTTPEAGYLTTNVIGLPEGPQTRTRKNRYQFYYNNHPKNRIPLQIKIIFKKQANVNALEPADSIFKGSKK